MSRRSLQGSRALVTGASSGIGRELAAQLALDGCDLIVTARRADRLLQLAAQLEKSGRRISTVPGDITDPDVRSACLEAAREQLGGLDLLVNNAGVGAIGPFLEAEPQRLRRVMEVNFFAPAELMRAAVPLLQQSSRGVIVNVSSVLAHRAVPDKSEYCASKFALHGLSDALRAEFAALGIDVILISPSTTSSEFFDRALEAPADSRAVRGAASPAFVARKTVQAIRRGSHEVILTPAGKLFVWGDRLFPSLMNRLVARFGR